MKSFVTAFRIPSGHIERAGSPVDRVLTTGVVRLTAECRIGEEKGRRRDPATVQSRTLYRSSGFTYKLIWDFARGACAGQGSSEMLQAHLVGDNKLPNSVLH